MHFYERIEPECKYEDGLVLKAEDAIQSIFQLQKSWEYRQISSAGITANVILALLPKFIADNPGMFQLSKRLQDALEYCVNGMGYMEEPQYTLRMMQDLVSCLGRNEKLLADFFAANLTEQYAEFLNRAFSSMGGQHFNIEEYPYLLFQAVLETLPDLVRYEGMTSGEHYTEVGISNLMSALVDIGDSDLVYDGACGYGIQMALAVAGTDAVPHMRELNTHTAAVARFLMLMIGKPEAVVECGDTVSYLPYWESEPQYDCFLTHPPVGVRLWDYDYHMEKLLDRDRLFCSRAKNDQWLFIRQALGTLKAGGRGVALMSTAVLNRDGIQYRQTRQEMIEKGCIRAVIELPMGVVGAAGTKWSILLFDRPGENRPIYILDLSRKEVYLNFTKVGSRMELDEESIEEIVSSVMNAEEVEGMGRTISMEEIIKNDFRLNMGAYIQVTEKQEEALRESVKVWEKRDALRRMFEDADRELEARLADYRDYLNQRDGAE